MIVLIPRASRFQFILGKLDKWDSDGNECVLKYIADLGDITSESPAADREDMKKACEIVLARSERDWPSNVLSGFSHKVYLLVISSVIDLEDKVLLERALPTCFSGPEYQPLLAKLREEKGPLWILARYVSTRSPNIDSLMMISELNHIFLRSQLSRIGAKRLNFYLNIKWRLIGPSINMN